MLNYLIELRNTYKQRLENASRCGIDEYLCEKVEGGNTLSCTQNIIYFQDDGCVYKLCSKGTKEDFINHCRLYDTVKGSECLIEVPLDFKVVDINGQSYNYTVVQRPTNSLGKNFQDLIEEEKITTQFMIDYIQKAKLLMSGLYQVHKTYGVDILNPRPLMFKYRYEADSYFWTDFKYWNVPWDKFLQNSILDIYVSTLHFNDTFDLKLDVKEIVDTAEKEWVFV